VKDTDESAIVRHIRGATVVHQSPFGSVEVPSAEDALSEQECEKWVAPFYRVSFRSVENGFMNSLRGVYQEITPATVELLLTDYNWRPRLTGAFFAALKRFTSAADHIGRLLVRSDLCFAGKLYCVALTEFNTPTGLDYLRRYLEYYLTRPDLDYDQGDAMGAIAYLDAINGTKHFDGLRPLWKTYVQTKSWKPDLDKNVARFADEMRALHECRARAEASS
jgi:Family of unknown function (DUF6000)